MNKNKTTEYMLDKYQYSKQNTKHNIAMNDDSQYLIKKPISRNGPNILN